MAILCLLTWIANINSCFSGEVVELLVSVSYSTQLIFLMMRHFSTFRNSKLSTLADFYRVNAEVTFDGASYSSLAIINKEELLGEWQVIKRAVFQEKNSMMEKKKVPSLHLCKT